MADKPTIPWRERKNLPANTRRGLWTKPPGGDIPQELKDELINWLGDGNTLSAFAKTHGIGYSTLWRWLKADPVLHEKCKSAREEGMDAIAEQCLTIIDQMPEMSGNRGRDAAYVQWMRARVETRLRLLAIWDPSRFSIKYQHKHEGGMDLQVLTGVPRKSAEVVTESEEPVKALPTMEEVEAVEAEFDVVERSQPYDEDEES